ncbi:MAG: hypothetical protein D3918_00740 [Candidatus Electrothrix sp. AX2]|nr:hypothetical protein [Candidatus Electrothrix gigas]
MSNIAVVHLVWAPLGIEPFNNFIKSYFKYSAGIKHDLIILFNGFTSEEETYEYRMQLSNTKFLFFFMKKKCLDIAAYRTALNNFDYDFFCFLNSYSVILDNNWLIKFYSYASRPEVGLVGATGGYESIYHTYYGSQSLWKDITTIKKRFISCNRSTYGKILKALSPFGCRLLLYYWYGPFPNYSIRTNAFMAKKTILNKTCWGKLVSKCDTFRFESGRKSLSKQIVKMGYEILIVGLDGKGYKRDFFYESNTFRSFNQENLLISDNRTNEYLMADNHERIALSVNNWGDKINNHLKIRNDDVS